MSQILKDINTIIRFECLLVKTQIIELFPGKKGMPITRLIFCSNSNTTWTSTHRANITSDFWL